jgi:hypothetical protein
MTYRHFRNGVLVRELIDGVELTENLGQSSLSFAEKVANASRAIVRVGAAAATGAEIRVSDEEKTRRLTLCLGCEHFTGERSQDPRGKVEGSCAKCGCTARWKTRLATEHCPIAKW